MRHLKQAFFFFLWMEKFRDDIQHHVALGFVYLMLSDFEVVVLI